MQPHVRNYFRAFNYDESSVILCECGCGQVAKDLHHVIPRSLGGTDDAHNIIALSRECHDKAHGIESRKYRDIFKMIIANR
jgi:5-methylcytosine-specific restriction endonuclease McrA